MIVQAKAAKAQYKVSVPTAPYHVLFFLSGFPALLYQIVWQRALFTIYGVNIESVTIIVTAFMLGLGLGSLAGGKISNFKSVPLLLAFGIVELGIGLFGAFSLPLFHQVALVTAGASLPETALVTMSLLLFPTLLMGITLPLMVGHLSRVTRNVGQSLGILYALNTLGSAVACVAAALFLLRWLGESGSVRFASILNCVVACSALLLYRRHSEVVQPEEGPAPPTDSGEKHALPFAPTLSIAALVGFVSLGYEIVWYRLFAFLTGGTAPCFALLLAFYLGGIAAGSLAVSDFCREKLRDRADRALPVLGSLILWSGVISFILGPTLGAAARHVPPNVCFTLVFAGASLLGAAFPLLGHVSIRLSDRVGSRISYVYLANIIGAASGSLVIGYVLMNSFSTQTICVLLLAISSAAAALVFLFSRIRLSPVAMLGFCLAALMMLTAHQLFSNLYAKLLFKQVFRSELSFSDLIETRSGVIGVTPDGTVFGGGVYDGHFSVDPVHDINEIVRAYAVTGFHSHPSETLMIGLGSGSWAQVVANNPEVQHMTVIDINPGYLKIVSANPIVSSLLHNPKVDVSIDDGRRWLVRHPDRKFDLIVMNTTYSWRAHSSNLLSVEFLDLIRLHLKPGGIHYYNTTRSGEVQLTGATVFPYALRVRSFLAVSDTPIFMDRERWKAAMRNYAIDGRKVLDPSKADHQASLTKMLSMADSLRPGAAIDDAGMESEDSLRRRWRGKRIVTDDNMGTEWTRAAGESTH